MLSVKNNEILKQAFLYVGFSICILFAIKYISNISMKQEILEMKNMQKESVTYLPSYGLSKKLNYVTKFTANHEEKLGIKFIKVPTRKQFLSSDIDYEVVYVIPISIKDNDSFKKEFKDNFEDVRKIFWNSSLENENGDKFFELQKRFETTIKKYNKKEGYSYVNLDKKPIYPK